MNAIRSKRFMRKFIIPEVQNMATCDRCGRYAYMRVDGSKRCASCNYESYPDYIHGIEYETASIEMKRKIDAYRNFQPEKHPKFKPFFEIADYSCIGKIKRFLRKVI